LLRRERDGIGAYIDATLIESMLSLVAIQLQEAQAPVPPTPKAFRPTRTADGHVMIPLVSARDYVALYPVIGKPEWCSDPGFSSQRGILARTQEIEACLGAWAAPRKTDDVVSAVLAAGLPCSRYREPAEVLLDEHLIARGTFAPLADAHGNYVVTNAPFRFADAALDASPSVAELGADTRPVLRDLLAVGDDEYGALGRAGAFGVAGA
jgi:crotonobetainyl-CoA:carnitine CoA-transferase CaiB-like acyl-CoA transferase